MNSHLKLKSTGRLIIVLYILIFFTQNIFSQTALPFIKNFNAKEYKAHTQNFAVVQDKRGVMYFGNFAGILEYDGVFWRLIPTEQTTKVSSLAINKAGKIFVGAKGEIGYLSPDSIGQMEFISLNKKIEKKYRNFSDVFEIYSTNEGIYFIAEKYIFLWNNKEIKTWKTENSNISTFYLNNNLFVQQKNSGLMILRNNKFIAVPNGEFFSEALKINSMFSFENNKILIATGNLGLFVLDNDTIKKFETDVDLYFSKNKISCGKLLDDGSYAFGTERKGLVIISPQGKLKLKITEESGLQNEIINSMFIDHDNALWLALNNGISVVEIPSPISYYDEKSELMGEVTNILRFENSLYVSTYQGLFVLDEIENVFKPIQGITTACWAITEAANSLLAATSEGVFVVHNNIAEQITKSFSISLYCSLKNPLNIFVGQEDGLNCLQYNNGKWLEKGNYKNIEIEIWNITEDKNGDLWMETSSNGILRLNPEKEIIEIFDTSMGLPSMLSNHINKIKNEIFFTTVKGTFQYNKEKNFIEPAEIFYNDTLKTTWIYSIIEDKNENLWTTAGNETNITFFKKINNKKYKKSTVPFLPVADFIARAVYPDENNIVWFGGPDGIIRYDSKIKKNYDYPFQTLIRIVHISGDSMIFAGTFFDSKFVPSIKQNDFFKPVLNYKNNSIYFVFAATSYDVKGEILYQYKLDGFQENWSDWTKETDKEYTNLRKGNYVFHVRAKNVYDKISKEAVYEFKILSPWYSTWLAYILYVIIAAFLIYIIIRMRSQQLIKEKRILEETITKRTAEIVQQKEEIEEKSDELASKNDELEKINEVVKSINSQIHFLSLSQTMLQKLKDIKGVEKATALLFDKSSNSYKFKVSIGWDISPLENIQLDLTQAEKRYLKNTEEIFEDIFLKKEFDSKEKIEILDKLERTKSMITIVIKMENKVEGFLILENMTKENAFGNEELSFVKNLKEHIISAFIKTKILEDLQKTLNNLEDTQDQLIQSEKLASLGQLTAGIAHEIKNPLNFINNFSSLCVELSEEVREILDGIKEKIPEDEYADIDEVIGMIESNAKKINEHGGRTDRIVKGMLQHSRGDSNEFQLTDINGLVKEYMNLAYHGVRAENKEFNTALKTDLDTSLDKINIVPQDLSRVILNIVNNACFAVNDKKLKLNDPLYAPEIFVSTRKEKNNVVIRIKDNGIGMPENVKEKIFNPFFTTKPTGKGTGLGLSMSFDIVTQIHKGKLQVETVDGESTEFILSIPLNLSSTES